MLKKLRVVAAVILALAMLNIYSWGVLKVGKGESIGFLTKPLQAFSEFPSQANEAVRFFIAPPRTYVLADSSFKELNNLTYNLYALGSFWNSDLGHWSFELSNLKDESILFSWVVKRDNITLNSERNIQSLRPFHSLLMENKDLVLSFFESENLMKLDSTSRVLWKNDEWKFHHSITKGIGNTIWVCGTKKTKFKIRENNATISNFNKQNINYRDDYIIKVDSENGNTLYSKSVSEILIENGLKSLFYTGVNKTWDPIHLNDIEIALSTTAFWKKGDLFISLRNLNLVVLYRPGTNRIIWYKQGPFLSQHDVDILDEHRISIFNNNSLHDYIDVKKKNASTSVMDQLGYNEIIIYDFESDSVSQLYQNKMIENELSTSTEGLMDLLPNGDMFFEEQNEGKVYVFNEHKVLLRKVFSTKFKGYIHLPNWTRIYTDETLSKLNIKN